MTPYDWQRLGACHDGVSWIHFYSADGERPAEKAEREARAKAICAGCEVRSDCLDFALSRLDKFGVWGGLTEDERASSRRQELRRANDERKAVERRAARKAAAA
jgi:WhiB family transcriptional regulator, redox-sensing transcriptional regulator